MQEGGVLGMSLPLSELSCQDLTMALSSMHLKP